MKTTTRLLTLCLILTFTIAPLNTLASSLEKLPAIEKSKQWEVVIGKPDNKQLKAKPDAFNIYSMDVKNIGKQNI